LSTRTLQAFHVRALFHLDMSEVNSRDAQSISDGTALADTLLERCKTLLDELEGLRCFLEQRKAQQQHAVDIRKFQSSVGTEYKSLQKVLMPL